MGPGCYDPNEPRAVAKRVTLLEVKVESLEAKLDNGWPGAFKVASFWACIAICAMALTRCMVGH
jgi:hypothetical protein